ncbi:glycosyltransferase family 2 protein [Brachyspira hyodysenteriae]|uniref:glycosyltransferase family 2 protein n=1 Tax=Brachyspira hyodysenteriae TaxID=159 RepID=UPI00063DBA94|nr:glycosyltransferase family 2 protein [Brachyspira hyodysenteriae]KLI60568.1 hypothetical protein SZ44_05060 [Brachyspira hyodysenteriae]
MIKVSVIIPVYNAEKYIEKCLDSVINQTLKEIEIICIDDCSTDNSHSILEMYKKIDNRIVIIKNEINQGIGENRNIGIKNATGEYLAFIDNDDCYSVNFLELLYSTAVKYKSDISSTQNIVFYNETENIDIYKIFELNNENGKYEYGLEKFISINFSQYYLKNSPISFFPWIQWSKLWSRDFILKNNIYFAKINFLEDYIFFLLALSYNPTLSYNNNAVYYYLQRITSETNRKKSNEEIIKGLHEVIKCVVENYINNINIMNTVLDRVLFFIIECFNKMLILDDDKSIVYYSICDFFNIYKDKFCKFRPNNVYLNLYYKCFINNYSFKKFKFYFNLNSSIRKIFFKGILFQLRKYNIIY